MNKSFILIVIGLAVAPLAASAGDAGKFYAGVNGQGLVLRKKTVTYVPIKNKTNRKVTKYKTSFGLEGGVVVGYAFGEYIRTELEGAFRNIHIDDRNEQISTGSLNIYHDFNSNVELDPYVGFGLGASKVTGLAGALFTFQLMTGINYKPDENSTTNVGYRYFNVDYSGKPIHALEVGYRYSF